MKAQGHPLWPRNLNGLIAQANPQGFLVCFTHLWGSLQNFRDMGELKGLRGVE